MSRDTVALLLLSSSFFFVSAQKRIVGGTVIEEKGKKQDDGMSFLAAMTFNKKKPVEGKVQHELLVIGNDFEKMMHYS